MDLMSIIRWFLIEEHRDYFIKEISEESYRNKGRLNILKRLGGVHRMAAEIAEETGAYVYADDLHTSIYAPLAVKKILPILIGEHGLRKVTEEIARQMQKRHLLVESREEIFSRFGVLMNE